MSVTTPSARSDGLLAQLDARFRRPLNRFFQSRTRDVAESEDLTQEVFLRLASRGEAGRLDNPEAFVFTVASNLLRDRGRRQSVRGVSVDHAEALEPGGSMDRALIEEIHPARVLDAKEDLKHVLAALNELPPRTRAAFVLRKVEGMSIKEVARSLGVTVSAVDKHLARAVDHLSARLED